MLVKICKNIVYLLQNHYNWLKEILELGYFLEDNIAGI